MKEIPPSHSDDSSAGLLRELNRRRLVALLATPVAGVVFDVDVVVRLHGELHPGILERHAHLLLQGVTLCPCTARGESLREAYFEPLLTILKSRGADTTSLPLLSVTRSGGITELPFSGRILESHPIPPELSNAFLSHPLIQILMAATPSQPRQNWDMLSQRMEKRYGIAPDSRAANFPGIFLDRHRDGNQYKLTMFYDPNIMQRALTTSNACLMPEQRERFWALCGGRLPADAPEMAHVLSQILASEGINLSISASGSEPNIDVALEGVDKSNGYRVVRDFICRERGLSAIEADSSIVTVGDTPYGNDQPLLACGQGVTNINYFVAGGPIVLDFPEASDQLARADRLFAALKPLFGSVPDWQAR